MTNCIVKSCPIRAALCCKEANFRLSYLHDSDQYDWLFFIEIGSGVWMESGCEFKLAFLLRAPQPVCLGDVNPEVWHEDVCYRSIDYTVPRSFRWSVKEDLGFVGLLRVFTEAHVCQSTADISCRWPCFNTHTNSHASTHTHTAHRTNTHTHSQTFCVRRQPIR